MRLAWTGELPDRWSLQRGAVIAKRVRRAPRDDEGVVTAFRDGQVTLRTNRRVDGFTEAFKETGYQGIRKGDLVIHGMDGFAGAIGVSDSDGKASPVVHAYRVDRGDARFFAHALRSAARAGYIESLAKGIRERSTAFDAVTFKNLVLPVPPAGEQRMIADFLDRETGKIDALIEKQTELITRLHERRTATVIDAVTGGVGPGAELTQHPDWIGRAPRHWEVQAIKRLTPVRRGASPRPIDDPTYFDDSGYWAWARIADVSSTGSSGKLKETTQRMSALGASRSVRLTPGSLFVSIAGTVGKPCITEIPACIHDGFVYFPGLRIEPMWLFRIFEGGACYKGLGKMGTQLNLNTETVGAIKVPVPPPSEQVVILDYLDRETAKIDELIAKTERMIELSRERRAALITAAVTGQIDVNEHGGAA